MLGIIIGIGSVIAILTVGDSLTLSVSENMQSMGANDVYVMIKQRDNEEEEGQLDGVKFGSIEQNEETQEGDYITNEMITEVCDRFADDIYAINIEIGIGNAAVEVGKNSSSIDLSGVTAGYFVSNNLKMVAGSMFSGEDFSDGKNAIIVSDSFVDDVFEGDSKKALGTEIEVDCNNYSEKYTIIGVYKYEENYAMGISLRIKHNKCIYSTKGCTKYLPY